MQTSVRMAIAGMCHGHVNWILRSWQRKDIDLAGFYEPDGDLAQRYAAQYKFPLELVSSDLEAMLDALKPEAVCAFGSIYDHLKVVEACAPRRIHVMVEKPLAVSLEHAEKMAALAAEHGIHLIFVDSDGDSEPLMSLWLEGGVTGYYPIERAAGMDAMQLRQRFGRQLRLIGGIDKRAMASGPAAIERARSSKTSGAALETGKTVAAPVPV